MKRIIITIETENAAFGEDGANGVDGAYEVARILERLAKETRENGEVSGRPLRDSNGNSVGTVSVYD